MKRRVLVKAILFLLGGAIINIAVAWGIAALTRAANNTGNPIKQGFVHATSALPLAASLDAWSTHKHVRRLRKPGTTLVVLAAVSNPAPNTHAFEELLPPVCSLADFEAHEKACRDAGSELGFFYWDGRGWPLISMASWYPWFQPSQWPAPPVAAGIRIGTSAAPGPWPYNVHDLRALPLCPVWPGFAVNTVFYGAILWMLFAAPAGLSRKRRRKRGLCVACGYSLRESVSDRCPECGHAITQSADSTDGADGRRS